MPENIKGSSNHENWGKKAYAGYNIAKTGGKTFRKKRRSGWLRTLKIIVIAVVVVLLLIFAGGLAIAISYLSDTPEFDPERLIPVVTSHIFDRHGNELSALFYDQNRIKISLNEIPLHVQNAFIAIEDARFYSHIGIDVIGFARAVLINVRQLGLTGPGGSTITQQLIKNAFLTPERTIERKVQEAYLALKMERRYSKAEILEFYLNQIAFGHGANGIEVASNMYFQKSTGELTIAEAAMLAAIPRAPSFYSPFINIEAALQRQGVVLRRMYDLGFISHEEWSEAKEQEIVLAEPPSREYSFPYFLDYVLHHELIDLLLELPMYNTREEAYDALYNQGLRIYTTLDPNIQEITQSAVSNENNYPQNLRVDMQKMKQLLEEGEEEDFSSYPKEVLTDDGIFQPQGAAVVADPVTGEVLALVGGRDYGPENKVLRFLSTRQPGSAIKPLVAFIPALEENLITPGSLVSDSPLVRGDWEPQNFDRSFRGLVTVRASLVHSLNIPAVRTLELVTPAIGIDYAKRLGLSTIHDDDYNLVTALGGMKFGVTAFDMAQAFAVLANEGIKVELHTIKRIEDRNGQLIYEQRSNPQTIISPQTAYLITDILQDVVRHGTAGRLRLGRPVAAKTGTTDDSRDAYLVAYTPDLVVSLWLGHDIPLLGQIRGGSRNTIPFMQEIMSQILENREPLEFTRPPGITESFAVCRISGLRPGTYCPSGSISNDLIPTALVPMEVCNLHVGINICRASGLLPGEYCPPQEITTGRFLLRPEGMPGRVPEGAANNPPTAYCDIHLQPAPPPTEFNLYLIDNPLMINLWWEWQEDVHEYLIYRRVANSDEQVFLQRIPGNVNHFADQTVAYGMTYVYQVFSVNTSGIRSLPAERIISTPPGGGVFPPPITLQE